jgi:hypothetical protein
MDLAGRNIYTSLYLSINIHISIYEYTYTSIGIENAVGTLGTAITKSQMDLAGKYLSGR